MSSKNFSKVLVANRGEIAIRIVRALQELGIPTVAVYAEDDAQAPHVTAADEAFPLGASGPAAYLSVEKVIGIAKEHGCDAIHPGYGFFSERADVARACEVAGIRFIGPTPEQLEIFGDKAKARLLAERCGVPLVPGVSAAVSLEEAHAFLAKQNGAGVMVKAIGGGGGRGMRAARTKEELGEAWERSRSEAKAAFGVEGVYIERLIAGARHIEIQVVADGTDFMALGERECTLQRRFQKLVEIAPSPSLSPGLRGAVVEAALRLAREVKYQNIGTFEFLVDSDSSDLPFVFIEANPRLQVEHTITEEVTGLDIVQIQIGLSQGKSLRELGLDPAHPPAPRGFSVQWRVNAETLDAQGQARPGSGTLSRFEVPTGPGIRVDTHGTPGGAPSPQYDTLLAKLIVSHPNHQFKDVLRRSQRALAEFHIEGVATNLALLGVLAARPEMASQVVHTRWLEAVLPELVAALPAVGTVTAPEGAVVAPMAAKLVQLNVSPGEVVAMGAQLAVIEAMKMEVVLSAPHAGRVTKLPEAIGTFLAEGQPIVMLEAVDASEVREIAKKEIDPDTIRPDLQRVRDRLAFTLDENRQAAVAKRHRQGGRMVRENVADLCDEGSFIEYGALAIAGQLTRRTLDDLVRNTPGDGMVNGIGTVNADEFGAEAARTIVLAYDYTVLAGTQGWRNHKKKDRLLRVAHQLNLPVVLFAEGGGGRPADDDFPIVAGLDVPTFALYAGLSGKVPLVGIVHGRCFAGNAALVGCADVIIATKGSNIGMGGPAMIEGGGLGVFKPEEVGPPSVQTKNGVIDVLVEDEKEAVAVAKQYLGYFQGRTKSWEAPDQRLLRHVIPENRLRVYEIRNVVHGLFDIGSVLELRPTFGIGIVTVLARIEGRPVGVIANNPLHLGGAIDAEAGDKSARFMQLCEAHGLPIISLCDTPGFMVGPDIEKVAQVRRVSRMFIIESHLSVPFFTVVLRKGYGLGAMGMTAGSFDAPVFNISWPTGEFGGMGLEGFVRLGYRKELEEAKEGPERDALYKELVAKQYAKGEATSMAMTLEIDAVIDPAETRSWLLRGLESAWKKPREAKRMVDTF